MRVAIDFQNTYNSGKTVRTFTSEFWQHMALSQPAHQFIFIGRSKWRWQPPENVYHQEFKKTGISWMDGMRFKKLLAKQQADKLIIVEETGFLISDVDKKKGYKKPSAQTGIQVSFLGNEQTTLHPDTTIIQPAMADVITSLTWAEAESIKTQYTGGRAFFLFTGDIHEQHQLIELLKAFSTFKKWQQSNMQLVIAGSITSWTDTLEEKLQTYKYREDVVLLKNPAHEETAKLVAASYAMVYPVAKNIFPLALLWAVQANKAVVATGNTINKQLTEAAIWVDAANTAEGFARALILLYKDENQQQLLIQQTTEQSKNCNRQQMLAEVWRCIKQ